MKGEFERVALPLSTPFTIARGTTETAENVIVRVERDGETGVGAAAPSSRFGETVDTVEAVLPDLLSVVEGFEDPLQVAAIERALAGRIHGAPSARAAVSVAVHDLAAKLLDVPLYRYWGLDPSRAVASSYSVGIADPETMADRAREAADRGVPILKVKLGQGPEEDREIVRQVRSAVPDVRIRVDANEAWTPREAVGMCEFLAGRVEFVEQPVPAGHPRASLVGDRSPVPLAADESIETAGDVPGAAEWADIATLKLAKTGGPAEVLRAIHTARAHGMEVMLGCMVESGPTIAAAAHLAPLVDYADLDGSLLLAEDPFSSPVAEDGAIDLEDRPGSGSREEEG